MVPQTDADFRAYGGRHFVEYAIEDEATAALAPLGRSDWADWDQHGRLVLARGGQLLHWESTGQARVIADVDSLSPDLVPAAASARQWPRRPPKR